MARSGQPEIEGTGNAGRTIGVSSGARGKDRANGASGESPRERTSVIISIGKEQRMISLMVAFLIALAVTPPDPF